MRRALIITIIQRSLFVSSIVFGQIELDATFDVDFTLGSSTDGDCGAFSTENCYDAGAGADAVTSAQKGAAQQTIVELGPLSVGDQGMIQQLLEAFTFSVASRTDTDGNTLTGYIITTINYFLGIAFFIAVTVLIVGFGRMIISGNQDEAFAAAKKTVVGACIAIALLMLCFLLARFIFQVYFELRSGNE